MFVVVDCEGEPIQEWSALLINDEGKICNTFHQYVRFPSSYDSDFYARKHVHGLNLDFLEQHGAANLNELKCNFLKWLSPYMLYDIYANAPAKESQFLSLPMKDAKLLQWSQRISTTSHQTALNMKHCKVPVYDIICLAHNPVTYKPSRVILNETDKAKLTFGHHCSLYDCVEVYLWLSSQ